MKRVINKKIFSAILCILIFSIVIPNVKVSATKKVDKYDVTINYGIDGKYRSQKYMPINIHVNDLSEDFNGEVEIRVASDSMGGYDAYSKEVTASAGESINVSIPVMFLENSSKGTICLIQDNKVVYEKNLLISSGRITDGNIFAGLLTDDATALGYLGNISFDTSYSSVGKINSVNLSTDIIGNNSLNIDGLDLIVINNYNMANLKAEQYDALSSWVSKGGTLLIGAGANEAKTINNMDKSFLNITSNGSSEKAVSLISDKLNLVLSSLNIDDSMAIYGESEKELVYSIDRGNGDIIITTFDMGLEPFISSSDASKVLQNILLPVFDKVYEKSYNGGSWESTYAANTLLNNIPVDDTVSTVSLAIILVVYAIIIGVVLYLVLNKLKRRDLIWAALPISAIVFTIIIYIAGNKMRVNDVILNSVNIISVDEEGKGTVNGYLGIGSKYKGSLVVEKDENLEMNYINTDNYYYGKDEGESLNKLRVKTTYSNDNSYFTFSNNSALEINSFEVAGKEIVLPKIEGDFNLDTGNLNGVIKNNLDSDITKLLVVSGDSVWDLGSLLKGEELTIEDKKIASSYGVLSYSQDIQNQYYEARWNEGFDEKDPKYKNIFRNSSLLTVLGNGEYVNGSTKVIAITDMNVDYNLNLQNKSVSNYNTTVIVQDIDVNFKDSEGNINFPEGYFKHKLNYKDNNVDINDYDGFIYGTGEVIFDYIIDENVEVKEITLKAGTDRWGSQYGTNSDYHIYNYETNEYEKISLSSGSYKVSNDGKYTLNNTIRIKINVQGDKSDSMAPKIIIKGVEK